MKVQFGASMGAILRPVDRIRTTSQEAEYPGQATYIDQDTVPQPSVSPAFRASSC